MEIIPLIYVENRNIYTKREGRRISLTEILKQNGKNNKIYVLDIDGIEKNKPNLCTYQRLVPTHEIWVDAGPRVIGDIVDFVMAGATNVTIRKNLFSIKELADVKELTESEIYIVSDLQNEMERKRTFSSISGIDGYVVFYNKNQVEKDFKSSEFLKNLCNNFKVYIVEPEGENAAYWKNRGVAGLLVDIERIKQVKI